MDFVTDDPAQPIVGFVAEVQRTDSPRCSNCGNALNAVLAGEFCAECGTKNPVGDGLENMPPFIGSHLPLLDNEAGTPDVLVPVVALAEVATDDTRSSLVAAQAVGTAADVHAAWLEERGLGQYADALQVRRPGGGGGGGGGVAVDRLRTARRKATAGRGVGSGTATFARQ
jgi:hypothetical protein